MDKNYMMQFAEEAKNLLIDNIKYADIQTYRNKGTTNRYRNIHKR